MIDYIIHGSCKKYEDVPEKAVIKSVNGRTVFAACEACGKPIFCDDETFFSDLNGVYLHRRCTKGLDG
jgi:hypothetical protein